MTLNEVKFSIREVSAADLETSERIEKATMVGYYAVIYGNKIWKSNCMTIKDAQDAIEMYRVVKGTQGLEIVKIV